MSRTVISAVVAGVIVVLTAIAALVTSQSFAKRGYQDADSQLASAYQLIQSLNKLQSIDVANKVERLASEPWFVSSANLRGEDGRREATLGFQRFMASDKSAVKPDILALTDRAGELIAIHEVPNVAPKQWLAPVDAAAAGARGPGPRTIIPALNEALRRKVIISDTWIQGDKLLKVAVAPVVDPYVAMEKGDPESKNIVGAIVLAYAQTAKSAQADRRLLGTDVAYFDGRTVMASSFALPGGEEDTARAKELTGVFERDRLEEKKDRTRVELRGTSYLAASVKLPRTSTKQLPTEYPPMTAGVVVLSPILPSEGAGTVLLFVIVLGVGALAIAMLGLYLVHRRLVAQIDQVELGVTDIINGNVDRTFRPVGQELDGLSNGLNVMLARLLGRPEPGEEELDDDGNPIIPGRVEFDEGEAAGPAPVGSPGANQDLAALARESEPDYYKRVYTEYLAAKRVTGHPDDVSFENFIAKLKVNEGKLRAQYQCRAVRFRVVTRDGKVSLKPVPIFA
jgi:hypothetical protein